MLFKRSCIICNAKFESGNDAALDDAWDCANCHHHCGDNWITKSANMSRDEFISKQTTLTLHECGNNSIQVLTTRPVLICPIKSISLWHFGCHKRHSGSNREPKSVSYTIPKLEVSGWVLLHYGCGLLTPGLLTPGPSVPTLLAVCRAAPGADMAVQAIRAILALALRKVLARASTSRGVALGASRREANRSLLCARHVFRNAPESSRGSARGLHRDSLRCPRWCPRAADRRALASEGQPHSLLLSLRLAVGP